MKKIASALIVLISLVSFVYGGVVELDSNGDGKVDLWKSDDGSIDIDSNGDGKPDMGIYPDEGIMESDSNYDGIADCIYIPKDYLVFESMNFRGPFDGEMQYDTNYDGKVDTVTTYSNGKFIYGWIDTDSDGVMNLKVNGAKWDFWMQKNRPEFFANLARAQVKR